MIIFMAIFIALGVSALLPFATKSRRYMLAIPIVTSIIVAIISLKWGITLYHHGRQLFFYQNFIIDSLSLFHILLINIMFAATSFYLCDYFIAEETEYSNHYLQRFIALWQAFQGMLLLVVLSNNIGITWIALETTTLVSAFLIYSSHDSLSIEAMWKYLLVCSIGIALGFIGTVLVISAAHVLPSSDGVYTFTELQKNGHLLNPSLMLFAFIFIVIGYGTKAGLAPMHTWLPDAHSQAPTPVSAVFSGVMLNCALFVIMRYLPIVKVADGNGNNANMILIFLGALSLLIAVIFIPIQKDIKRLLAYCSVEHIGIIAIALGLGGVGTAVALLHTLNHSVAKILGFFSAGVIIKKYKTRCIDQIHGVLKSTPFWGTAFLFSMFALAGIAPSSIFLSEFMIIKTAFDMGNYVILGITLLGTLIVFASMLKYILSMVYGKSDLLDDDAKTKVSLVLKVIVVLFLAELLILGLYLPEPLMHFLQSASHIIEKGTL